MEFIVGGIVSRMEVLVLISGIVSRMELPKLFQVTIPLVVNLVVNYQIKILPPSL